MKEEIMPNLKQRIINLLEEQGHLTDRQITDLIYNAEAPQQPINQACRQLQNQGIIIRRKINNRIQNTLANGVNLPAEEKTITTSLLSEDNLKKYLTQWLEQNGWKTTVAWGHKQGVDIDATKNGQRWIIEVKGIGTLQPMRVNYFIAVLGETIQRMDDPKAQYSIALPDIQQYRGLWNRLPRLAKQRTQITILFVDDHGGITHINDC